MRPTLQVIGDNLEQGQIKFSGQLNTLDTPLCPELACITTRIPSFEEDKAK
jgi:hypothetical protein